MSSLSALKDSKNISFTQNKYYYNHWNSTTKMEALGFLQSRIRKHEIETLRIRNSQPLHSM